MADGAGARRGDTDDRNLHRAELSESLIRVEFAFSREAGEPRQYVQDRVRTRGDDMARLLRDQDAHFHICGHQRMEDGIDAAFTDICADHGIDWEKRLPGLRDAGRYHLETYS